MTAIDWFALLHPVLVILFVYPVVGATIRLGILVRERRLGITKQLPAVSREHADHSRWVTAGVVVAVMVVVGLPAAGAVLVTALVVIPPVAARQWTDRAATMVLLAGFMGLVAALVGVAASAALPGLPTGPLVVLAAAALCAASFLVAPRRGWLARRLAERAVRRQWLRGLALEHCLRAVEAGAGGCSTADIEDRLAGDGVGDRAAGRAAWNELVRGEAVVPAAGAGDLWQLSASGRAAALERRRRIGAWRSIIELAPEAARESLSIDLPAPEAVLDAGLIAALRRGTA